MNKKIFLIALYKNRPIVNLESLRLPFSIGSDRSSNLRLRDEFFKNKKIVIESSGENIVVKEVNGNAIISFQETLLDEFVVMDSEVFSIGQHLKCKVGFIISEPQFDEGSAEAPKNESVVPMGSAANDALEENEVTLVDIDEKTLVREVTKPEIEFLLNKSSQPTQSKRTSVVVDGMQLLSKQSSIAQFSQSPLLSENAFSDPSLAGRPKALEANLFWKGKLLESKQLRMFDTLVVGPDHHAGVAIPQFRKYREMAKLTTQGLKLNVPSSLECKLLSDGKSWGAVTYNNAMNKSMARIEAGESIAIKIDEFTFLYLKLIPTTVDLAKPMRFGSDLKVWEIFLSSGFLHVLLLFLALLFAPAEVEIPKLENVPKRYAKLLVKKPVPVKPKPKPKTEPPKPKLEPKKPEPKARPLKKKLVERKPKPKSIKKVLMKKPVKKINKYPLKLKSKTVAPSKKKRVAKDSSKVQNKNMKNMGALGALLKTPSASPSVDIASININKNAGGPSGPTKKSNALSKLSSKNGRLSNSGSNTRVSTKGAGVGDGSSYGVQGLKGSAGGQAQIGQVGRPDVGSFSKTEGLSTKEVMAVVNKHLGEIQACYEKALVSSSSLVGRVEFEWLISPTGKVGKVRVKKADLKGDGSKLTSCVMGVIRTMRFPKASNGESTSPSIGFPFGRY